VRDVLTRALPQLIGLLAAACAAEPVTRCEDLTVGEGGAPWAVSAGDDSYPCFVLAAPFDEAWTIEGWEPIVDDALALHHFVVYRTSAELPIGPIGECTIPEDATIVAAWSPGNDGVQLPDGVGLEIALPGEQLLLQMHYLGVDDARDASGVRFCATEGAPAIRAGTFTLGTAAFEIPPRARGHEVLHRCEQRRDVPLTVLAAAPHMHRLGRSLESRVRRGGPDGPAETLIREDPFDYDRQVTRVLDPPVVIHPGDVLETSCVYDNPSAETVRYGIEVEDEMCFDYLTVFPIDAFDAAAVRFCY